MHAPDNGQNRPLRLGRLVGPDLVTTLVDALFHALTIAAHLDSHQLNEREQERQRTMPKASFLPYPSQNGNNKPTRTLSLHMEIAEQDKRATQVIGTRSLAVPQSVLDDLGWIDFLVTNDEIVEYLSVFMRELAEEPCTHSWRTKVLEGSETSDSDLVHRVLAEDRSRRPTRLFTYLGRRRDGTLEPVAVAAISDRVCATFEYDGFPVLARSFIRRAYRGKDLYPIVLKDRIEFCKKYWGANLKAIHLGSADERVVRTIERGVDGGTSFLYVGDEWLVVAGARSIVRDYLALSADFQEALLRTASALRQGGAEGARIGEVLETLVLQGGEHASFAELRTLWTTWNETGSAETLKDKDALQEFISMCMSIPITS